MYKIFLLLCESGLELSTIKVINRKSDKSKIVSDSFFQILKLNRTSMIDLLTENPLSLQNINFETNLPRLIHLTDRENFQRDSKEASDRW